MAAEEDKTKMQSGDKPEDNPAEKKKAGNKLFLFGGIGLGAVVIGLALAMFVIKPMMSSNGSGESTGEIAKEDAHGKKDNHEDKSGHDGTRAGDPVVFTIKDIVINPAGTGGTRFLSVSFGFELDSPAMLAEFEAREPIIRDALITILSSKTVPQLTDFKQKEIIRYQIKKKLEKVMETDKLAGVYYTDFVLQ